MRQSLQASASASLDVSMSRNVLKMLTESLSPQSRQKWLYFKAAANVHVAWNWFIDG